MILTCYFVDKSVVRVLKMDLIIASIEAYIGKMPNLYMCSIQMSQKYVRDIGLIASSLENRHVGLIQSRVWEGAQMG